MVLKLPALRLERLEVYSHILVPAWSRSQDWQRYGIEGRAVESRIRPVVVVVVVVVNAKN